MNAEDKAKFAVEKPGKPDKAKNKKRFDVDDKDLAIICIAVLSTPTVAIALWKGEINAAVSLTGIAVAAISGLATGRKNNNQS